MRGWVLQDPLQSPALTDKGTDRSRITLEEHLRTDIRVREYSTCVPLLAMSTSDRLGFVRFDPLRQRVSCWLTYLDIQRFRRLLDAITASSPGFPTD